MPRHDVKRRYGLAWVSQVPTGQGSRSGSVNGALVNRIEGDLPMTRKTLAVVLAFGVALCWGIFAQASPPRITSIRPFGVQRGVASEVTIAGTNLAGNPRLIAPSAFLSDPVDPKRT